MKKRIIAILCTLALLIPMAALSASALGSWTTYSAPADIDYSFAVFGDMQSITWTDNRQGTSYVKSSFDWILNNKDSRKIEYVFGLGDTIDTLTTYSTNVVQANGKTQNVNEWIVASSQFHRLDGVIPYTVIRGNHDDEGGYHKYICTENYKEQMDGFFYDSSKPATLGNSMSNSYRKIEIGGVKYLMLSIDYNAGSDVLAWANDVIINNPEYRVIAAVHAYLDGTNSGGLGKLVTSNDGFLGGTIGAANADNSAQVNTAFSGKNLWDNLFSKHKNMFMVLCGHDAIPTPVHNVRTGQNGNQVIEILTDTSKYDLEMNGNNYGGSMMMLINFREDTNEIQIEYLSPSKAQAGHSSYHISGEQISFSYTDLVEWEPIVRELGLAVYVGDAMTVSPKLDGVVNTGEYSYSKYYAPEELIGYDSSVIQGGIYEYIAHDEDYIYYAVSITQEADNMAFQWQFNPYAQYGIFNDKTNLKNTLFQRVSWQLRYQSNGTTTLYNDSVAWNYAMDETLPVVGTDLQYAATKTAENLKTYEVKLSKEYLAEYNKCDKEDIKVLPYMTHQHSTTTIAHNYTQAEVNKLLSYGASRADTGTAPKFMVLGDGHSWNEGVVTTPATHLAEGVKTYTCSDCGETKTEVIAKTTAHTFGEWTKHDSTEHKHTCACGEIAYAAHTWNSGVVTTPATHLAEGVKTYTCTGCGETKTEVIAKTTAHTFGEWTKHDSTEHKHTCACGEIAYAAHTWNSGVVTTPATHLAEGVKTYTCTGCGETKTEVIAKTTAHTFGEWTKHDSTEHKHTCACGAIEYAAHTWNSGVVTTPATQLAEGVKTYTCTGCDETKTEVIPKLDAPETTAPATTNEASSTTAATTATSATTATDNATDTTTVSTTATVASTATTEVTATAADTTAAASNGCNSVLSVSALVMIPTALAAAFVTRRKEER